MTAIKPNPLTGFSRWLGEKVAAPDDFHSRVSERSRDVLAITTAGGVAVGATVGVAGGAISTLLNKKTEGVATRNISHPRMTGYDYWTREDTSEWCTGSGDSEICFEDTDGWYHRYSPEFEERVVGTFDEPAFHDSHGWTPIQGGLIGAAVGGLAGLGLGIGINLFRKVSEGETVDVEIPRGAREDIAEQTTSYIKNGVLVGGGTGMVLGGAAGFVEQMKSETVTRTWDVPDTKSELMGHVPENWYENTSSFRPSNGSNRAATKAVFRQVPQYDNRGEPLLKSKTGDFNTARFGPITGAIFGGVLGVGIGVASGVVAGVAQKLAAYEE